MAILLRTHMQFLAISLENIRALLSHLLLLQCRLLLQRTESKSQQGTAANTAHGVLVTSDTGDGLHFTGCFRMWSWADSETLLPPRCQALSKASCHWGDLFCSFVFIFPISDVNVLMSEPNTSQQFWVKSNLQ